MIVYKCESFWISYQEQDEMTKWISSRIPVPIMPHAIMKNVSSWFDQIVSIWILEIFIRKEPKVVLSYWGMICNGSYSMSA